jgi:hypothetical protein
MPGTQNLSDRQDREPVPELDDERAGRFPNRYDNRHDNRYDIQQICALAGSRDLALARVRRITVAGGALAVLASTGTAMAIASSAPVDQPAAVPVAAADPQVGLRTGREPGVDAGGAAPAAAAVPSRATAPHRSVTRSAPPAVPARPVAAPGLIPVQRPKPVHVTPAPHLVHVTPAPHPAPVTSSGS